MSRVRIWTAPERLTGEIVAEELRAAGLPVTGMQQGTDLYPASPLWDLYLEDEKLLENPSVRQTIKDAIDGRPMTPQDVEMAAEMPYEEPSKATLRPVPSARSRWMTWIGLLLMAAVLWLVVTYLNKMFAGEL
jgi:hypothetical protein